MLKFREKACADLEGTVSKDDALAELPGAK